MRVVQISASCGTGSIGKICVGISEILTANQIDNRILYSADGTDYPLGLRNCSVPYIKLQALKSRILGNYGFNSNRLTRKMIAELEEFHPDLVHLHNLHGHDCNLELLFRFLKRSGIQVVWTFHDCWAFTGYCPHYDMVHCEQWKTECRNCPKRREYSWFFDRSYAMFCRKKNAISGTNLTIAVPSKWMKKQVSQSFLRDFPVEILHNGIDLDLFSPRESDFREKYQIGDKYIVLGVAFGWNEKKGLDIFIELSKRLDARYQIVLVGTDHGVDRMLPQNIISIHRTQDQKELAEIYSASNVLANPTREDTFPTVNIEAIACGLPVVTFDTGGSLEMLNKDCGIGIACNDINKLEQAIRNVCEHQIFRKENCVRHAREFQITEKLGDYLALYEKILSRNSPLEP